VDGINLDWCAINGGDTGMGFVIDATTNSLFIAGLPTGGPYYTYTVTFNVAVIKNGGSEDGKGWLSGQNGVFSTATNNPAYTRTYTQSIVSHDRIPISTLTNGKITTAAGLSGYKVYVIVRTAENIISNAELNGSVYGGRNVITVYPKPY